MTNPYDNLTAWGWDADWTATWTAATNEGEPGRVVAVHRGQLTLRLGCGTVVAQWHPPSSGLVTTGGPTVGDWCGVVKPRADGPPMVRFVLPRRAELVREAAGKAVAPQVLAANIDTVFLVCGLDRSQGLRSIERLLALTLDSGATPVVLLNKVDLCDNLDEALLTAQTAAPGFDVLPISATGGRGLEQLHPHLRVGKTVALLGPSGAGKSSLLNALAGTELAPTGDVRGGDRRGRHTTTRRQLYPLPGGALIADTPGLRELGTWITGDGLRRAFDDIEAIAIGCRFRDCRHDHEPGCAVREALMSGDLDERRFARYLELSQEVEAQQRRREQKERGNAKRRFKEISRSVRRLYRDRDKP